MSNPKIKLQFLGGVAAGELGLTGSCILLTVMQGDHTTRILIDLGLIQCSPQYFFERNIEILQYIDPRKINVVILTHAHTDHVGRLPILIKHGFNGRIFCTTPTSDLLEIMLNDSAKIQAEFLRNLNRKERKKHTKKEKGFRRDSGRLKFDKSRKKFKSSGHQSVLYDAEDIKEVLEKVKYHGSDYHTWMRLDKNIDLKLYQSGHVLGGAICVIRVMHSGSKDIHLGFSGDLGRVDGIILPPPEMISEQLDCWVTESTYGGKTHPQREDEIKKLITVITEAIETKGVIIIPSFALERAQEILYLLSHYMETGVIPKIQMYLDAPMATKITQVFSAHWDKGMFADQNMLGFNPFDVRQNKWFKIISEAKHSDALIRSPGPYIVIAGSGTCDAGRVREHLRANLGKENTVVLLVGYMPAKSLGRKLKENAAIVKMNDHEINIKSKNIAFDAFSAHADGQWLASYTKQVIESYEGSANIKQKIFIVHGDPANAAWLREDIMKQMKYRRGLTDMIFIPKVNEEFTIT